MAGSFSESLIEFITRVEGAYGMGSNIPPALDLVKATGLSAGGNQLVYTDFFTATYGRKVWDVLNNQTKFFNILRKVPFGTTVGWRNRSARNSSTQPILENTNLPAVQKQTYKQIYSPPRAVVTMLGVTEQSQYMAGLEGGIGDALAVEQEFAAVDHVKDLNQQLLARDFWGVNTSGASGAAVFVPFSGANDNPRIGDCVFNDQSTDETIRFSAISSSDGKHSWSEIYPAVATGTNPVQDTVCQIRGRGGATSIEDIVNRDGRSYSGLTANGATKCYNWGVIPGTTGASADGNVARTANTFNAAYVVDNSGVLQYLETELLDEAIRKVRERGGEPDIIVSGFDQLDRVDQLLQGQRRYMPEATFQVKRGGEATLPGFQAGFQLSTYRGIPWFPDIDVASSYGNFASHDFTLGGSNVLVLDTRWLEVAVASMTRYFESRDYLQNDMLGIKAMFFTYLELRCLDVMKQAKVTDLKAV